VKRRQFLVAGAAVLATSCTYGTATSSKSPYPAELAANPDKGVWPSAYRNAPKAVRTAYQYAAANYETLRYIPCFCGCGLSSGHVNNYECFVKAAKPDGWFILDPHGLGCGTCVAITLEVIAMREQGMPVRSIRVAVDDRWSKTGPATKTPLP
jgi:hypothetical protein